MFKLNLKIALRNLWKYKGYTAINVIGLAIGLASCLLIFLFLRFQTSFDTSYEKQDRIYRVVSSWTYPDGDFFSNGVPVPLAPALRNDFSQLEQVAAVRSTRGIVLTKGTYPIASSASSGQGEKNRQETNGGQGNTDVKRKEQLFYVEPQFFDIFNITWLSGKPAQALTAPGMMVMSEKTAVKYFGSWQNAIGKSITFDQNTDFKITGVYKDFPQNSNFPFELVASYASFPGKDSKAWGSVTNRSECYALLKPGVTVTDLDQPLKQFIKKYYVDNGPGKENHIFQPMSEVHHDGRFNNFKFTTISYKELAGLAVIGVFLLITACINFINLATAQAISRSKEVGVRKVMGSRRSQLVWQFLSETTLITIIALLLACVITELAIPGMEHLMNDKAAFRLFSEPAVFVFMLLLVVFVSFMAGFYPALVISGFSPALAIKNKISAASAGGLGLRKTLVVVQFTITGILIITTLVVVKQMTFIREKSLGFDHTSVAVVDIPSDSLNLTKLNGFRERIMQLPGIKESSYFIAAPMSNGNSETNMSYDHRGKDEDFQLNIKMADEHYLKTFNLRLLAGRGLSKSDTVKEYVVNEKLLKMLGVLQPEDVIGKTMKVNGREAPIVGVIKDFNNNSLKEAISPLAIFSNHKNYSAMGLKINPKELNKTMSQVEQLWSETFPNHVYEQEFLDHTIENFYRTEQVMGVLFKVFAGVIIFISFIGLFGLVSFIATQRTREIAIRKVLGASTIELVKMLNRSFLYMVLIANVVAWPLAYIITSKWLNGFEYRTNLSIWPFLLAMVLSVLITLITVSLRSLKAAKTNPIDALKYE
ncbi:ABC transporter permease [Pedobacter gandavensis]|uniref:FtsX-like permease family protein n=1 Tax=Pedobacter gandavensis TaxID=2679963 RepID=A0ABR6EVE0_9SPHI|nr:ABC transporter permease [Pedobacter gandavensis]MBB2149214.1 FtsX-like permease family protein [Pedobacter gandavensis]